MKQAIAFLLIIIFVPALIYASQVDLPEPGSPTAQDILLAAAVNDNDTRITALEALAVALGNRATALEGRAGALEGRAVVLESRALILESRATALEARAANLEAGVAVLESRTTILETEPPAVIGGQTGTLNTWNTGSILLVHRAGLPIPLIDGKSYTATIRLQTVVQDGSGNVSAGLPYSGGNLVISLRWRFRSYENPFNMQELGTEVVHQSVATFTINGSALNDETVTCTGTVPSGAGTILGLDNTYLKDVVVFVDAGTTANGKAVMDLDLRITP